LSVKKGEKGDIVYLDYLKELWLSLKTCWHAINAANDAVIRRHEKEMCKTHKDSVYWKSIDKAGSYLTTT